MVGVERLNFGVNKLVFYVSFDKVSKATVLWANVNLLDT